MDMCVCVCTWIWNNISELFISVWLMFLLLFCSPWHNDEDAWLCRVCKWKLYFIFLVNFCDKYFSGLCAQESAMTGRNYSTFFMSFSIVKLKPKNCPLQTLWARFHFRLAHIVVWPSHFQPFPSRTKKKTKIAARYSCMQKAAHTSISSQLQLFYCSELYLRPPISFPCEPSVNHAPFVYIVSLWHFSFSEL